MKSRTVTALILFVAVWVVLAICAIDLAKADTTFGLSTPKGVAGSDAKYGHVDVYRKYFGGLPEPIPNRPAVISFKASPSDVVAGRHDTYLRNWFRNAPNKPKIWWAYWHEPQDFQSAASQRTYRMAWRHIVAIERSTPTNRNLKATYIDHMNSVWKGEWNIWYPGDKHIDVIAFDGKIKNWNSHYIPARKHYAEGVAIARRHDKPWGLAEYGATILDGYNAKDRARWMRETAHWLDDAKAKFACWWDQNGTHAGTLAGDFRLNDRPSIDAMRWMLRGRWQ